MEFHLKIGRPKLDPNEVKNDRLEIRINNGVFRRIANYARRNNLTMSQTLRKGFDKLFDEETP